MDTRQAELEISQIKKIMEDSRKILIDDGLGFIVWGLLVFAGLIFTYLAILKIVEWNVSGIAWIVLIGSGWIFTFFQVRNEKKKRKVVTFADKVAGAIWGSAGITMTIIGFVGSISGSVKGFSISPLMSCVLAVAFYVSGVIYNDKLFRWLGFGWWAGAIVMFYWHSPHTLLLFAMMILFMQVLPGILMYKEWKQEKRSV